MKLSLATLAILAISFIGCKKEEPRYCYECIVNREFLNYGPMPSAPYELCDKTQKEIDEYTASKYLVTETLILSVECNRK